MIQIGQRTGYLELLINYLDPIIKNNNVSLLNNNEMKICMCALWDEGEGPLRIPFRLMETPSGLWPKERAGTMFGNPTP